MTHDQTTSAPVEVRDTRLTRPIVGIKNRTAQEVFDIMCDRIAHTATASEVEPVAWMYTHPKCTSYWRTQPDEGHAEDGWTETPLYTHPAPPADLGELVEAAWRAGFQTARDCLPDDADDVLTEDVEHDAWLDSDTRTLLAKHGGA